MWLRPNTEVSFVFFQTRADEKENGEEEKVVVGEKRKIIGDKKDKTKKRKVESMEVDE